MLFPQLSRMVAAKIATLTSKDTAKPSLDSKKLLQILISQGIIQALDLKKDLSPLDLNRLSEESAKDIAALPLEAKDKTGVSLADYLADALKDATAEQRKLPAAQTLLEAPLLQKALERLKISNQGKGNLQERDERRSTKSFSLTRFVQDGERRQSLSVRSGASLKQLQPVSLGDPKKLDFRLLPPFDPKNPDLALDLCNQLDLNQTDKNGLSLRSYLDESFASVDDWQGLAQNQQIVALFSQKDVFPIAIPHIAQKNFGELKAFLDKPMPQDFQQLKQKMLGGPSDSPNDDAGIGSQFQSDKLILEEILRTEEENFQKIRQTGHAAADPNDPINASDLSLESPEPQTSNDDIPWSTLTPAAPYDSRYDFSGCSIDYIDFVIWVFVQRVYPANMDQIAKDSDILGEDIREVNNLTNALQSVGGTNFGDDVGSGMGTFSVLRTLQPGDVVETVQTIEQTNKFLSDEYGLDLVDGTTGGTNTRDLNEEKIKNILQNKQTKQQRDDSTLTQDVNTKNSNLDIAKQMIDAALDVFRNVGPRPL